MYEVDKIIGDVNRRRRRLAPLVALLIAAAVAVWALRSRADRGDDDDDGARAIEALSIRVRVAAGVKLDSWQESDDTVVGDVETNVRRARAGGVTYSISLSRLPWAATAFTDDDELLERAQQRMLRRLDAERDSSRPCSSDEPFDRAVTFHTRDGRVGRALLALDEQKLLVVSAVAPRRARRTLRRFARALRARGHASIPPSNQTAKESTR
jgi:hypothetical protein